MLAVLIALLVVEPSPPPRPRPTPPPVLEGRVQGPDGMPIADALVVVRAKTASWTEPPLSTRTEASGAFRLPLRNVGAHDVWAHAPGLAVAKRDDVRPGTPLTIRLESGGLIEGVVRDASRAPVEGARVETEDASAPAWVPGAGTASASTDRNGRFRLTGLDRRPHAIVATARGLGRARQEGVLTGRSVELFLVPGASVSGVVVDAEGRSLVDVIVRLEAQDRMLWTPSARTTDAKGRFAFDGVAAGTYALVARHAALGLASSPGIEVGVEGDVRRDVIVLPGVAVTGRLVDPDDQPVAGRVVVGEIGGEPAPRAVADALGAEAGADGRFRVEGVPLGSAALAVTAPGFGARRVDFDARPGASENDLGDVTLDPGLRLRGRLRSRTGAPVSEARLYAHQRIGNSSLSVHGTSDEAGGFVIGGLKTGRAHVSVEAPGFAPLSTEVEAGASDLDLLLDPAGSIAGSVVDEKGAGLPSFRVSAVKGDYEGDAQDEFSPADGRFVLEDVGAGLWTVSVAAPGHAPASVPDVAVRPGRTTDVGRVRLTRGATVRGQVVTADDSPVPGATIQAVQSQPMAMSWGDVPTASSDPSGLFELTGVPPGTADVMATHPSLADNRVRNVEVDPTRAAEIRIVLGRGGQIEGTARRRDGASLAGAFVQVMSRDGGWFPFEGRRAPVGPDGFFALDRVPAGPMRVALMLPSGGGGSSSSASREVEVRDGETVAVDLVIASIFVSGRVTRGEEPLAGARVYLRMRDSASHSIYLGSGVVPPPASSAGPERGTGLTDEAGFYQLFVDAPGPGWASVEAGSPPVQHAFPDIELPDAESYTLDLALGAAPLSGVVVDAETSSGLGDAFVSASRREGGRRRGSSRTGFDGRFRLEVEPGDYRLFAHRDGYSPTEVEVSPGIAGLSEIVLAMEKGETISGQLVDARGNGVAGSYVTAAGSGNGNGASTLAEGHFRITGLKAGSYTLFAGAAGLGFAMRPAVTAPADGVTLQLAPGGRVRVRALDVDGSPAKEAWVRIAEVDGLAIQAFDSEQTSVEGLTELATPAGLVTLEASGSKAQGSTGRVTVAVAEGQTLPAEIALKPPEKAAR